jgi:hypothetical protein
VGNWLGRPVMYVVIVPTGVPTALLLSYGKKIQTSVKI